jgi:hypothetical protein
MLQNMGVFNNLSEKEQDHRERFVYFVDMAYFLKQRIYGMDVPYISGTIFGNYKQLTIEEIYKYLGENENNTGFEFINFKGKNEDTEVLKKIKANGTFEYTQESLANILDQKSEKLKKASEDIKKIRNNELRLKTDDNSAFLFDISEGVNNAEDVAIMAAGQKL